MWWGSGLGAFEQPEGTPCWHKARKLLSCGGTASCFLKYLSPNQSGAEKPANIICCRWISDGSCTASWVWHGLIPLVFAGYLPSQQPDICGVNHFQLFHRRKLSSSINNNSSRTGVSVFAWGSGSPLLPFLFSLLLLRTAIQAPGQKYWRQIAYKIVSEKVAWFVPLIMLKTWGTGHRLMLC